MKAYIVVVPAAMNSDCEDDTTYIDFSAALHVATTAERALGQGMELARDRFDDRFLIAEDDECAVIELSPDVLRSALMSVS